MHGVRCLPMPRETIIIISFDFPGAAGHEYGNELKNGDVGCVQC